MPYLFIIIIFFKERESASWEGQREKGRESQADSMPSTEPNAELDLTTLRSGPEPKSRVRRLTDCVITQVPQIHHLKLYMQPNF